MDSSIVHTQHTPAPEGLRPPPTDVTRRALGLVAALALAGGISCASVPPQGGESTPAAVAPGAAALGLAETGRPNPPTGAATSEKDPAKLLVRRVYRRLGRTTRWLTGAWGVPELVFTPRKAAPYVVYFPCSQRIAVDATWIDAWRKRLGADADHGIAMLLAHELGHHLEWSHHPELRSRIRCATTDGADRRVAHVLPAAQRIYEIAAGFCADARHCAATCQADCGANASPRELSMAALQAGGRCLEECPTFCNEEWGADYLAGFIGHLAGYETLSVGRKTLDIVYDSFPDKQAANCDLIAQGYPALSDRKAAVVQASDALTQLQAQFDLATVALAGGESAVAEELFTGLTERFPSPEMFNNLAVALIRSYLDAAEDPWSYPLEWLPDSRLAHKPRGAKDRALLRRARAALRQADALAPRSPAVAVNLVVLDLLDTDPASAAWPALVDAISALRDRTGVVPGTADVLAGLHAARSGAAGAEQHFITAAAAGHPLGAANLATLRGEASGAVPQRRFEGCERGVLPGITAPEARLRWRSLPHGDAPVAALADGGVTLLGYATRDRAVRLVAELHPRPAAGEVLCGVRPGDTLAQVTARLGPPDRTQVNAAGGFLGYSEPERGGVVIRLDDDGHVLGWTRLGAIRLNNP